LFILVGHVDECIYTSPHNASGIGEGQVSVPVRDFWPEFRFRGQGCGMHAAAEKRTDRQVS